MDEDERGHRTDVEDLMFLPRLCDVLSLRWYSIGDWRATGEKKTGQSSAHASKTQDFLQSRHH